MSISKMHIRFYTLLYIDINETRQLQGRIFKGVERIKLFLKNVDMLNRSLQASITPPHIEGVTILTNNQNLVESILRDINASIMVQEIPFILDVPKGITFYSAHFKIDAFRYFATLPDSEYSILVDSDIVALGKFPDTFFSLVEMRIPLCYYIKTENCDKMVYDCQRIEPSVKTMQWTGGEFWGGTRETYSLLYKYCQRVVKNYFSLIDYDLYHVGDEMITSIAVQLMKQDGYAPFYDAGLFGFIVRYWGMHEKSSITDYNPVLVHLPADKVWIATQKQCGNFDSRAFIKRYDRHLCYFRLLNRVRPVITWILKLINKEH